jgi:hypothetical protein
VRILPFRKICVGRRQDVTGLVTFLFFFFPCCEDLLDLLRPLNFSTAVLTELGLEKNLVMTILAEESLLVRPASFRYVGDPLIPYGWSVLREYVALRRFGLKIVGMGRVCCTVSLQR